ncbi:molybdenum cofactor biosysynthesis protein [Kineococcus sp. SYSU DK005]|uniref:molybdenum cofactor biosysynthesis protein n=1 Tax=Kineococcus sp. SYSU DK005 TaxID=3383126 RepID=UPI003D7CB909
MSAADAAGPELLEHPVRVLHLLVSPEHAYFGRPRDGAADVPTHDLDEVEVVAGKGIRGDRFFGKAAHMDAAVTFLAAEAWEAVAADLALPAVPDPLLARRNLVVRGVELDPLRGHEFELVTAAGTVRFRGGRPANPCAWMDRVVAPGAHRALRGRGGLRCTPLSDGRLSRGAGVLRSPVPLDPARAGEAVLRRTPLP